MTSNPPKGEGKADAAFQAKIEKLIKEKKPKGKGVKAILATAPKSYCRSKHGVGFMVSHYASDVIYESPGSGCHLKAI